MIAETSLESWSDDLKAERIRQILEEQLPTRFPQVRALVWFEEKNTGGVDFSILQDQGPRSQETFRQAIASPYYAANGYGDLATSPIPPPTGVGYAVSAPGEPVAGAAASASTVAAPAQESAIVDPGFEEGAGDGQSDGWSPAWVVPPWMASVVKRDGNAAASGLFSMLHASTKGESYAVYQEIPVVAGGSYDVWASLRVEQPLQYGKAALEIQSLNANRGTVETKPLATWQEPTDGWVRVGGTIRIPSGAVRARVQIRVTSLRGAFRLDDFSMTRSR